MALKIVACVFEYLLFEKLKESGRSNVVGLCIVYKLHIDLGVGIHIDRKFD